MTRLIDVLNRILVFLTGLIALAIGILIMGLYWDHPIAQSFVDSLQPRLWGTVPSSRWFLFTVGLVGVLSVVFGVYGIVSNVQRHRIRRVSTSAGNTTGEIDVDLCEVAQGVADSFLALPKVFRAKGYVQRDRGRRVMHINIGIEPTASLSTVIAHGREVENDIAKALRDPDLAFALKIHVAPVERIS